MKARFGLTVLFGVLVACGGEVSGANGDASGEADGGKDASSAQDAASEARSDVTASEAGGSDGFTPDTSSTRDVASDALGLTTFACGSKTCRAPSQFCYLMAGGPPPPPDASSVGREQCNPMPSGCESAPTCACIRASVHLCVTSCMQAGDEITIQCDAP